MKMSVGLNALRQKDTMPRNETGFAYAKSREHLAFANVITSRLDPTHNHSPHSPLYAGRPRIVSVRGICDALRLKAGPPLWISSRMDSMYIPPMDSTSIHMGGIISHGAVSLISRASLTDLMYLPMDSAIAYGLHVVAYIAQH